ncbi:efflux RND transporter periplasmic adaptor subunit [Azospirillum sp. ST 5-10]|uniref:efflux RND transporter periplasmic adaptor subunit n=1 Tax=unclassified Azospirillum TaxID=2630922 RepID=UPI003F4A63C8
MNRILPIGLAAVVAAALAAGAALRPDAPHAETATDTAAASSVLTVTATTPSVLEWPQTLTASGPLAAWQEAVIGAEVGSLRITDLFADVGTVVTRGQELARLSRDSARADVRKQEATVAEARAKLAQAEADARRARKVKGSGALSEQQVTEYLIAEDTAKASLAAAEANLESSRITLGQTSIRAVDDGVITARSAALGTVVSAGTELFRLQRQGRVEWRAELDARQLARVRPGQTARVTLPDGRTLTGAVRLPAPSLDGDTGRGIVYVALPAGSGAVAGGYASGTIELETAPALTVPQSAVVLRDGRAYVFSIGADGRVRRHGVTTGRHRDARAEILTGLPADLPIVESGGAFLSDGSVVTAAPATTEPTAAEPTAAVPEDRS